MPNNRSTLRTRLGAVICCAILAPVATWATTNADGTSPIEVINASSAVAQPAAATQQAKRLMINSTKPIFPMQVAPTCYILDNFSDARSGGRSHEGTDILADRDQATYNQEVYAVVDGTLSHQVINGEANSSLSGNSWRLTTSGSKTYYAYMHLARFAAGLSNGSFVSQGQLLGYVGDTGNPRARQLPPPLRGAPQRWGGRQRAHRVDRPARLHCSLNSAAGAGTEAGNDRPARVIRMAERRHDRDGIGS